MNNSDLKTECSQDGRRVADIGKTWLADLPTSAVGSEDIRCWNRIPGRQSKRAGQLSPGPRYPRKIMRESAPARQLQQLRLKVLYVLMFPRSVTGSRPRFFYTFSWSEICQSRNDKNQGKSSETAGAREPPNGFDHAKSTKTDPAPVRERWWRWWCPHCTCSRQSSLPILIQREDNEVELASEPMMTIFLVRKNSFRTPNLLSTPPSPPARREGGRSFFPARADFPAFEEESKFSRKRGNRRKGKSTASGKRDARCRIKTMAEPRELSVSNRFSTNPLESSQDRKLNVRDIFVSGLQNCARLFTWWHFCVFSSNLTCIDKK